MQTVVGVFTSQTAAERAADQLCTLGIPRQRISFLLPGDSKAQLEQVPTTGTEQPGMGAALGGVVGGAMGASGGLMAPTVISALIPGIGTVTAIGLTALSLIGLVGGALAGAAAGNALEDAMSDGLPKDELYVYEDALRQGRSVLIVLTESTEEAEVARVALVQAGAESLDAAREQWWLGMRDAEAEAYMAQGGYFTTDEKVYRRGFEAALRAEASGQSYGDVLAYLRLHYADVYNTEAFRRGYERGCAYYEALRERRQG